MSLRPSLGVDADSGEIVRANRAAEDFWGYDARNLTGKTFAELVDPAGAEAFFAATRAGRPEFALPAMTIVQSSGATHIVSVAGQRLEAGPNLWACEFREGGRISQNMELRRLNWALSAYARSSSALIHMSDTQSVMAQICEAIVEQDAYVLACVALYSPTEAPWLDFAAAAGPATGYLEGLRLTSSPDMPEGFGPTGRCLRSGSPHLIRDSKTDPVYALWRERGSHYGFRSTVTVPIRRAGQTAGALLVYASKPNAFGPTELNVFWRLSQEIGLALAMEDDRRRLRDVEIARRLAEERAQAANAELQRVARFSFLGEFAAALAHEINQPLGATRVNADAGLRWLDRDPPETLEARAALERIRRDVARANEIVARTRAMYVTGDAAHADFDLSEAVEEVLVITRDRRRSAGVELRFTAEGAPAVVRGDRTQIQQVVFNLVTNAEDAMATVSDRPRTLEIRLARDAESRALVTVEDNGPGVGGEAKPRIFERFFTTKTHGTGLGLAISRRIVEAHGGRLWFEPRPRFGSRFLFTLAPAGRENSPS